VITSDVYFEVDGLRCAATLYRPDSTTDRLPCVVMGHGITLTRRDGIPAYAERFVAGGVAAFAFDYRHWGDSEGEPRRWFSVHKQRDDWHAAVAYARASEAVDPDRIALWGMSLGGGHALTTAAADPRIAAVVALVPCADGLPVALAPAPTMVVLRTIGRALREAVTHRPVTVPVAGAPGSMAVTTAPEALPGFTSVTTGNGWRNEVSSSGLFAIAGYRPVRHAARIQAPVLLQLAQRDAMVPPEPIEKTAARAGRAELLRYPIDHFGCFAPEHIDEVAADEVEFLRRHLLDSAIELSTVK
jgi:dienelactone hydrolase